MRDRDRINALKAIAKGASTAKVVQRVWRVGRGVTVWGHTLFDLSKKYEAIADIRPSCVGMDEEIEFEWRANQAVILTISPSCVGMDEEILFE